MHFFVACSISAVLLGTMAVLPGTRAPSAPASAAPDQQTLLGRLRAIPGLSAHYREEKVMGLLAAPLVTEGELYFEPPGRLARHQTSPAPATVLVDEDELRFGDEHGIERVDLGANPVVRLFVESFVQLLAGDENVLESLYTIEYRGEDDGSWTMVLRPRKAPVDKVIDRITLHGRDVVLDYLEILEVGGDITRTTFSNVNPRREFSRAERRRLFRIRRR